MGRSSPAVRVPTVMALSATAAGVAPIPPPLRIAALALVVVLLLLDPGLPPSPASTDLTPEWVRREDLLLRRLVDVLALGIVAYLLLDSRPLRDSAAILFATIAAVALGLIYSEHRGPYKPHWARSVISRSRRVRDLIEVLHQLDELSREITPHRSIHLTWLVWLRGSPADLRLVLPSLWLALLPLAPVAGLGFTLFGSAVALPFLLDWWLTGDLWSFRLRSLMSYEWSAVPPGTTATLSEQVDLLGGFLVETGDRLNFLLLLMTVKLATAALMLSALHSVRTLWDLWFQTTLPWWTRRYLRPLYTSLLAGLVMGVGAWLVWQFLQLRAFTDTIQLLRPSIREILQVHPLDTAPPIDRLQLDFSMSQLEQRLDSALLTAYGLRTTIVAAALTVAVTALHRSRKSQAQAKK